MLFGFRMNEEMMQGNLFMYHPSMEIPRRLSREKGEQTPFFKDRSSTVILGSVAV